MHIRLSDSKTSNEVSFTAVQLADIFGLHIKTVRKWRLQGQVDSTPAGSRLKISYGELLTLINRGKRIDRRGALRHGLDPDRVLADAEMHPTSRPPVNYRGPFACQADLPPHYAVEVGLRRLSGQSIEIIREDLGLSGHAILALEQDFKERLQSQYSKVGHLRDLAHQLNDALT